MDKKLFFPNNLEKWALPRNLDICGEMDKKRLFQNYLKKRHFKSDLKNDLCLEMLIFSDILA